MRHFWILWAGVRFYQEQGDECEWLTVMDLKCQVTSLQSASRCKTFLWWMCCIPGLEKLHLEFSRINRVWMHPYFDISFPNMPFSKPVIPALSFQLPVLTSFQLACFNSTLFSLIPISLMGWVADSLSSQGALGGGKGFIASGIISCSVSFRGPL